MEQKANLQERLEKERLKGRLEGYASKIKGSLRDYSTVEEELESMYSVLSKLEVKNLPEKEDWMSRMKEESGLVESLEEAGGYKKKGGLAPIEKLLALNATGATAGGALFGYLSEPFSYSLAGIGALIGIVVTSLAYSIHLKKAVTRI